MNSFSTSYFSGTSGLVLPIPQSQYPPEFQGKSRLNYYASLFNSVEINSSFYKQPLASTVSKWEQSVPQYFRFTFKMPKIITHVKSLEFSPADVEQFMVIISYVRDKKGCVLIQFPPALRIEHIIQLEKLLRHIQYINTSALWKIAVEFRHHSWYHKEVYSLLKKFNVCMVVHDLPASATPINISTADFIYLRFHGPGGKYRGSYHEDFLNKYAELIKAWNKGGKEVYSYFNNTMGDAVKNVSTLSNLLQ